MSRHARLRWLVADVVSGPSPTSEDRTIESETEWGVLKTTAVRWSGWDAQEHKVLPESLWGLSSLAVRPGDVLVTKAGPRHRVGVSAYVDRSREHLIVSGKMVRLRANPEVLDARYLNWYLSTSEPQAYLNSRMTGMAESQMNFANDDLLALDVVIPELAEQRRIADFLDTRAEAGRLLARMRREQIVLLSELARSSLATRIDELISRYGTVPLRRIVHSVEQGSSPQCDEVTAHRDEWAVLKTSAVSSGIFLSFENKRLPNGMTPQNRYRISDGDVLMTRGSGSERHVGVAVEARPEGRLLLLSDLLYRIRVAAPWSSVFLVESLQSLPVRSRMSQLFRVQSGQTIKLRIEDVRAVEVPAVPAHLQNSCLQEVKQRRDSINEAVERLETSIELLEEQTRSLIDAVVTGQVDVATARRFDK